MRAEPAPLWVLPQYAEQQAAYSMQPDPELLGKTVLVVLTGSSSRVRVLKAVQSTGVGLVVYAPTLAWASELIPASRWIQGPVEDTHGALAAVQAWLVQQPPGSSEAHFDGIMCYDEYGIQLASALGQGLGLPFMPPRVAESIRNKHNFRAACHAGGVPAPRFLRLNGPTLKDKDIARITEEGIKFPVIVKPCACAGSFSVLRCRDVAELCSAVAAFYDGLPRYLSSAGLGPDSACALGGMLVEEYISGEEVDIDCIVVRGQLVWAAVSDNHPPATHPGCNTFVERGGRCPSSLHPARQAQLLHMASQVVGLWGTQLSGVCHLEAFSTATGAVPIELNARIGGAETYTNVLTAWGVDLAWVALRVALGAPPVLPPLVPGPSMWLEVADRAVPATGSIKLSSGALPSGCRSAVLSACDNMSVTDSEGPPSSDLTPHHPLGASPLTAHVLLGGGGHDIEHDTDSGSECGVAQLASGGSTPVTGPSLLELHSRSSRTSGPHRLARGSIDDHTSRAHEGAPYNRADAAHFGKVTGEPGRDTQLLAQLMGTLRLLGGDAPDVPDSAWPCLRIACPLAHVSSVNFVPDWEGEGVVMRLEVSPATLSDPTYVDAQMYAQPGARVFMPPLGFSALGWMVARGCDPLDADAALAALMPGVHIELRTPVEGSAVRVVRAS